MTLKTVMLKYKKSSLIILPGAFFYKLFFFKWKKWSFQFIFGNNELWNWDSRVRYSGQKCNYEHLHEFKYNFIMNIDMFYNLKLVFVIFLLPCYRSVCEFLLFKRSINCVFIFCRHIHHFHPQTMNSHSNKENNFVYNP